MKEKTGKYFVIFLVLVFDLDFAQERNPTVYPYGGVPDSSRFGWWMQRVPLNFKKANFDSAQFDSLAYFGGAKFHSRADFRSAKFDSISFYDAFIRDKILLEFDEYKIIDFTNTNFIKNAKIVLFAPVNLVIQPEKIKYISLGPRLDYFSKKKIIEYLKNKKSFKDDNKVQFELSYIFDKSTIYQKQSNRYEEKWYQVWKYPKWFLSTLYYLTMGLDYRPFRLVYWVI